MKYLLGALTLIFGISGLCSELYAGSGFRGGKPEKNEIEIVSYNLENLFDPYHDEGKDDWDFVPIGFPGKKEACMRRPFQWRQRCLETDWTEAKFQLKLQQIKSVFAVQRVEPDILAVQEIENEYVVQQLANEMGFDSYIFEEGRDRRGIDTAILYRTNKIKYLSHKSTRFQGAGATRDILSAVFEIKGSKRSDHLAVYVNHWPSQGSPSKARVVAANALKRLMDRDRQDFTANNFHAVVLGDFNTIPADYPHPFKSVILNEEWDGALIDMRVHTPNRISQPMGTYFYPPEMSWSFLDRVFVTPSLRNGRGLEVVDNSFRILYHPSIARDFRYNNPEANAFGSVIKNVPHRYNFNATSRREAGFSDHYPVAVRISH